MTKQPLPASTYPLANEETQQLSLQITQLEEQLAQEKKITKALLERVKISLTQQANASELFEHNSLLLYKFKEAKKKLIAQSKSSEKLVYLTRHDALTGLPNRIEFESKVKRAVTLARKSSNEYVLCFLDLDQFKVVNDTAGHMAGDEMLKQLSVILQNHIRKSDTLARLGGDEFGLLIENCDLSTAKGKVQDILELIDDFRFQWDNCVFRVSASVGMAIIDQHSRSYIDLLKQTDIACYAAKNSGRNRLHVYQEQDENLVEQSDQMLWVPKINEALEKDRFKLYAQAIMPTDTSDGCINFEVLIRLQDSENNIIPPGAFLPTAERYNLITKIDYWVIQNTFAWLQKNRKKIDPHCHFSINLSGQSLGDENVLYFITDLLGKNLIPTSMIHFEVTETMAISNLKSAKHFIQKVRALGCGVSLDDFGSGLSSFGYLKNLDVDTLKIDGIFVRDILDDPIDAAMVEAINTIGHVMGLKTVAEFVENEHIARKLIEIGVDYLQGYGIGKPLPIDDILLSKYSRLD